MTTTYDPEMERERRQYEADKKAKDLVDQLGKFANGMSVVEADALSNALANEHPTLLGQIAKAVGKGVVRRALYDATWRPYGKLLPEGRRACVVDPDWPEHAEHDGRLDCTTVIGAELMARQSFI